VNARQIWQTVIERLQARVEPAVFVTWFQGTSAQSFQDGVFIVLVPTTFAKSHLEKHFIEPIRSILADVIGIAVEVQFVVATKNQEQDSEASKNSVFTPPKRPHRLGRGRFSTHREKRIANAAANAMHSMASLISPSDAPHTAGVEQSEPSEPSTYKQSYFVEPEKVQEYHSTIAARPSLFLNENSLLNPRYTFNAFIVGKSNQLAHAASLAVSENPGHIYNPLFLYGGVGLGKTHLLHAVGHVGEVAGLTVLYVTSEKFTNEIINAIRYQKTEEFREKYRQIDILLVDDIQFIAGKESTEEEFFHTFNALHSANKQIVVTSDRPPKAIPSLQDRLRSRFEWGLLADVQAPEYEHRLAILRSKVDSLHFAISSSVVDYIARPECHSVRELEGALNRVIAYATLQDAPITVQLASKALEHIYTEKKQHSTLTVSEVLQGVSRYYNVEAELLRGKQRDRNIVWPRQVAMYLMREETNAPLLQIGTELGGRDHTTIIHGWEKVRAEMAHNDRVRHEIAAVLESLQRDQL
jgi:chromosomal replication initiator protein